MPRANSYNIIIDAAEAVVIEAGASHMTLDAVAAKAGVSKGGLLHHFPNKVALLVAMVERQIKMHQDARKKILKSVPGGPGRELKGFIIAAQDKNPMHNRLGASMSAAVAHDPRLNEPIRKVVRENYIRFTERSGMGYEKAAIIALAVDGLRFQEMLSISPFDDEQRSRILGALLDFVDEPGWEKNRTKL
jgi:AcrR family transcriptional regulator